MNLVLKILGGKFGAAVLGAAGVAFALLAWGLAVQSSRLDTRTAELATAKAALVNPVTRRTWQAEATACAADVDRLSAEIADQSARVLAWEAEGRRLEAAAAEAQRRQGAARAVAESRSQAVMALRVDAASCEAREAAMLAIAREALGR